MAQPSLSYTVKQLEDRLGVALFDRGGGAGVELTRAGEGLLPHARRALASVRAGTRAAREAGGPERAALRVGYNDGEALAERPGALRALAGPSSPRMVFRRVPWGKEAALDAGRVDALLTRLPVTLDAFEHEVVAEERRLACLSRSHRLASRERLVKDDLLRERVVMPVGGDREWREFWRGGPYPNGAVPPPGPTVQDAHEALDAVAATDAVCLVPEPLMLCHAAAPDLSFLPVDGLDSTRVAVVWRGARDRAIDGLILGAKRVAASP